MFEARAHEESLVRSFIVKPRQQRLLYILGNKKRRHEGLKWLAHFDALDPRWSNRIPGRDQTAIKIAQILRDRGAPETCYVISEDFDIDGGFMALGKVLESIVGGLGTFLSCIPGRFGYFEGEAVGERFILERPPSQHRT